MFSFAGQLALNVPEDHIAVGKRRRRFALPAQSKMPLLRRNLQLISLPRTARPPQNNHNVSAERISKYRRTHNSRSTVDNCGALGNLKGVRAAFFMRNLANVAELSSEKFVP
ncbi:MAG: hypothetical protein DMF27_13920 [Verrucomicrobia bacterium]|nr:MAG: hypothetical protein DME37_07870 [Verrucomicrobiota bacterium]PYL74703.1 MAG: hypothetical protein DMF27_13920 [Verrucomicrobiota bacterium]PYM10463.1 MAG: hypothetical protein DMF15_01995 [Verrucomicrobiota bacterium]